MSLSTIYDSLLNRFKNKTNLSVSERSVLDSFLIASSSGIQDAYNEIEKAKNPHIFTKLTGSNIDSMGMLVGCARREDESDNNYLYRMLSWNTSNQASNSTAIDAALQNLEYSSNASYVPFTQGVGTATIYIIPKVINDDNIKLAIKEVKERISKVISPSSYIEYVVPTLLPVKIVAYLSVCKDEDNIKSNIINKMQDYINSIAPGDYLELGQLEKIGTNEANVNYFSISFVYINDEQLNSTKKIQKLEEKFLFDEIIWNMVVS